MARNLLSPVPYTYAKHQPPDFMSVVARATDEFRPDIVHTDFLHVGVFGLSAARRAGVPAVLRAHNVDSVLMARFRGSQRDPAARAYAAIQHAKLVRYERRFLSQFDRCVAVTPVDARELSRLGGGIRVDSIPAGVDTGYFRPSQDLEEPDAVVSVALMRWTPNVVSTTWFLDRVLPIVVRRRPRARFYVVGSDPPDSVRRYHDGHTTVVTGFVEDVRPFVARASVFVVPTRVGSGIRIKVLEALAMGKAVVSTSVGCEGIDGLVSGQNIVIADGEQDFAEALLGLMADPARRAELGRAGRQLVLERYQWDAIGARFEALYQDAIRESRERTRAKGGSRRV